MRYLPAIRSLFALTAMATSVLATAGTGYNLTATPSLQGIFWMAINNVGDFAGSGGAYIGGQYQLSPNPGWYSSYDANTVNDHGVTGGSVGWYDEGGGSSYATYTANGQTTFMHPLNQRGFGRNWINNINNAGLAAGTATTTHYDPAPSHPDMPSMPGTFGTHAFRTDGVNVVDIATLGGVSSGGNGINNNGQIVGWSEIDRASSTRHSFLYARGEVTDLGEIGGSSNSEAIDINDAGLIIGNATSYGQSGTLRSRAYIYENGHATLIDTPAGFDSVATALNNHGQVIGSFTDTRGRVSSFLYENGTLTDLNSLVDPASGWRISSALDINDHGQILVSACKNGTSCAQFLLSPDALLPLPAVPEPETYAMLLTGLGLLGWSSRRKRSAK